MRMHVRPAAFTLVEVVVVIGIIAALVGLLYPLFVASRQRAAASQCEAKLQSVALALQRFVQDNGHYPNSLDSLVDGYLDGSAPLLCPNDAHPGRSTYDLFYARRGRRESHDRITAGCALHDGYSGMLVRLDGQVDRVTSQTAELEGDALVLRRQAEDFAAHNGRPLNPGDAVMTESRTAALVFADGSRCELAPDSQVGLSAAALERGSKDTHVLLYVYWGEVVAEVERLFGGSSFEIATGCVVAGVRGTRFGVQVDKNTGESVVAVYSGKVQVNTPTGRGGQLKAGAKKRFRAPKDSKQKKAKKPKGGGGGGGGDDDDDDD